jgi:hydroxymethylglutaryl-CoA lyase
MSAPRLSLPEEISIREVGPRDGLQSEAPIHPHDRACLVERLASAGCRHIEVASFVSEKAVPAMAGAGRLMEVIAESPTRKQFAATVLVPNLRGAEAAIAAGADELSVTIAASPVYNERNVRRTIGESLEELSQVITRATEAAVPVDAVISCAFGSPYENEIRPDEVARIASELVGAGAQSVTLADTTGVGTPLSVAEVIGVVRQEIPGVSIGMHLHETRGTAMLNAYVAMSEGISRFDTSVGGLGGSPFAQGSGGNLATEDFVDLLDRLGIVTGIALASLLASADLMRELVGHELKSKVHAGYSSARLAQ